MKIMELTKLTPKIIYNHLVQKFSVSVHFTVGQQLEAIQSLTGVDLLDAINWQITHGEELGKQQTVGMSTF